MEWRGKALALLGMCVRARMRRCVNKTFRNGGASADVSRSQSHKAGAFRNGGASAHVSRRRGRRLQDPPRMFCLLSRAANVRARAYAHGRVRVCVCVCACIGLHEPHHSVISTRDHHRSSGNLVIKD